MDSASGSALDLTFSLLRDLMTARPFLSMAFSLNHRHRRRHHHHYNHVETFHSDV